MLTQKENIAYKILYTQAQKKDSGENLAHLIQAYAVTSPPKQIEKQIRNPILAQLSTLTQMA